MQDINEGKVAEARARADLAAGEGDFAAVREALEGVAGGAGEEYDALLGLACFQLGDYPGAATHYAAALVLRPDDENWRIMRERATANAEAEIDVFVPPVAYYDREALLAPLPARLALPWSQTPADWAREARCDAAATWHSRRAAPPSLPSTPTASTGPRT